MNKRCYTWLIALIIAIAHIPTTSIAGTNICIVRLISAPSDGTRLILFNSDGIIEIQRLWYNKKPVKVYKKITQAELDEWVALVNKSFDDLLSVKDVKSDSSGSNIEITIHSSTNKHIRIERYNRHQFGFNSITNLISKSYEIAPD